MDSVEFRFGMEMDSEEFRLLSRRHWESFGLCEEDLERLFGPPYKVARRMEMEPDEDIDVAVNLGEAQAAFAEWDRRYREEPETFMNEVEHLLRETPESYGEACGAYFFELLEQLAMEEKSPGD